MERMLREWRLRHHERLAAQAQEGGRPPYKRIALIVGSYVAWGLLVFWAMHMVEHVGLWLALIYWASNPLLITIASFQALLLNGQEEERLVRYEFGEERDIRGR